MGLEETLLVETLGTRDHSSLNMITASHTADHHHGGNSLMVAEMLTLTLNVRGVPVQ